MKKKELTLNQLNCLKKIELEILIEIDRICRKNKIEYSLAAGTLLGAIRHNGFIPWDDDVDIFMTRDYYNIFTNVVNTELDKKYRFVDAWNCSEYGLMFAKIMTRDHIMREVSISKNNSPCGVFVDVFVLDKTSDDGLERKKQFEKAQLIKRLLLCKNKYYFNQGFIKDSMYKICGIILALIPKKVFLKIYDENAKKFISSSFYISLGENPNITKTCYNSKLFNDYIDVEFEKYKVRCIKRYDEMLKIIYGDYMILPPIEMRKPHHYVTEIELD